MQKHTKLWFVLKVLQNHLSFPTFVIFWSYLCYLVSTPTVYIFSHYQAISIQLTFFKYYFCYKIFSFCNKSSLPQILTQAAFTATTKDYPRTALEFRMAELQVSAVPSRVFTRTIRTNEAFYLSIDWFEWSHNLFGVDFEIHWFISVVWGKTTSLFTSHARDGSSPTSTATWARGTGGPRGPWLAWVSWGALVGEEQASLRSRCLVFVERTCC